MFDTDSQPSIINRQMTIMHLWPMITLPQLCRRKNQPIGSKNPKLIRGAGWSGGKRPPGNQNVGGSNPTTAT